MVGDSKKSLASANSKSNSILNFWKSICRQTGTFFLSKNNFTTHYYILQAKFQRNIMHKFTDLNKVPYRPLQGYFWYTLNKAIAVNLLSPFRYFIIFQLVKCSWSAKLEGSFLFQKTKHLTSYLLFIFPFQFCYQLINQADIWLEFCRISIYIWL